MAKVRISLKQAEPLAGKIKQALAPGCERIAVAGSIRRKKATVGDIELVVIPKRSPTLLPNVPGASLLDPLLQELVSAGRLAPGDKNGPHYKNFRIPAVPGLTLDLFITSPECWPVIFAIRTGSAEFSRRLVTPRRRGGLLPSYLKVTQGRVWDGDTPLPLHSERELLELCGGWLEPAERQ